MYIIILYTLGPIIVLVYKVLEYYGFWNYISGRKYAISGLRRLNSTSGYPISWIGNEGDDKREFNALLKRIKRNTKEVKIKNILKEGHKPSLLVTGGSPILLEGIPKEWPQEQTCFYSSSHPVIMMFGVSKIGRGNGKAEKCCALGELEKWIDSKHSVNPV